MARNRPRNQPTFVKSLERIPGGRRRLYPFTAIDDSTRFRVLKVYDACTPADRHAIPREVVHRLPFWVHVIQTDYGAEFQWLREASSHPDASETVASSRWTAVSGSSKRGSCAPAKTACSASSAT